MSQFTAFLNSLSIVEAILIALLFALALVTIGFVFGLFTPKTQESKLAQDRAGSADYRYSRSHLAESHEEDEIASKYERYIGNYKKGYCVELPIKITAGNKRNGTVTWIKK